MKQLGKEQYTQVNGGSTEGAGYAVGYAVGFLARSAMSIVNGSAGYRIGKAIYVVSH